MATRVVAVLGYSHRRTGRLHAICADRLAHAQGIADGADAVIFSGFSDFRAQLVGNERRAVEADKQLIRLL